MNKLPSRAKKARKRSASKRRRIWIKVHASQNDSEK